MPIKYRNVAQSIFQSSVLLNSSLKFDRIAECENGVVNLCCDWDVCERTVTIHGFESLPPKCGLGRVVLRDLRNNWRLINVIPCKSSLGFWRKMELEGLVDKLINPQLGLF